MSSADLSLDVFKSIVDPWYDSLKDPAEAQNKVLKTLLDDYAKTEYGKKHGASNSFGIDEYAANFPIVNYLELKPLINDVLEGRYQTLLPEPPLTWVMTRGTTGPSKILPVTQKHVEQILLCGARAISNFILRTRRVDLLFGKVLNLNFPSCTGSIKSGQEVITYGHSSGTYAKFISSFGGFDLVPSQDKIDSLGGGLTWGDWLKRFELTYQLTREEDVRVCMGVAPVLTSFARYVKRKYNVYPKNIWGIKAIFCTSVPKIQWKYAPVLKAMYGDAPVIEMYTATEGAFAQQVDDLPYVSPNYDTYLFEVVTGRGVKMLCKMKRGEWGRLIISSCLFPRYDIGDMVECLGGQYFRIFGRAKPLTILEHIGYRILTRWFI